MPPTIDSVNDSSAGPPRLLLDLADGVLADDEVDALVQIVKAASDAYSQPVPAALVARAAGLARLPSRQERSHQSPVELLRRLVAELAFDTRLTPAYAGMRSEGPTSHRLLYSAEGYEIDLQILPGEETVTLRGELSAPNGSLPSGQVRLVREQLEITATLDEHGQFALSDLDPGAYLLEIQLRDTRIELPNLII
jgi:hypothetical protein